MAEPPPAPDAPPPPAPEPPPPSDKKGEPVWTFRGYRMSPGEFNTAMAHFYRGEIYRSQVWRQRLDNTTNWAVLTTGATLSFALSDPNALSHHLIIPLNTILITLFLFIEARRYRYYELWASRVRLMETDFYSAMLIPPFRPSESWAQTLAESLIHPDFPISFLEAFGRRFRRNYWPIFLVLALSWIGKSALLPTPVTSWAEFVARSTAGPIPGSVMLAIGAVFYVVLFAFGIATSGLARASGEVLPRYGSFQAAGDFFEGVLAAGGQLLPQGGGLRRREHMTMTITGKGEAVSQKLLYELHRGVTRLQGTGMFSGQARDVLLCAVYPSQIAQLKALVQDADPDAFIVVQPAENIYGKGFRPL